MLTWLCCITLHYVYTAAAPGCVRLSGLALDTPLVLGQPALKASLSKQGLKELGVNAKVNSNYHTKHNTR